MTWKLFDEPPPKDAAKIPKRHGHAAPPGTGPAGETCGSCAHLECKAMASRYYKCGLMKKHWTGGIGTDVCVRDAACAKWEKPIGLGPAEAHA